MGLLGTAPAAGPVPALSDDERAARIEVILGRARRRRGIGRGDGVSVPQEDR